MNRLHLITIFACSALLFVGCDDDSGDTDAGTMMGTDAGPGGTDAGPGETDAGPGETDAGPGETDAGPGETDAGPGETDAGSGGASAEAIAFCTSYEAVCGYGAAGRHADMDACTTAFDGYDTARQMCVTMHLGLAESTGMTDLHCPHATGMAPCD